MSTLEHVNHSALENQAFALMNRLHVMLRRNGRVTDVEYMRINAEYCKHVLEIASGFGDEDMRQICQKLQDIFFGQDGLFTTPPQPVMEKPGPAVTEKSAQPDGEKQEDRVAARYVGRLR